MNGIICVYKEQGFTSFDVVAKIRRLFATKKVGHGGTLDPMAEGVLPVFVGSATKAVDFCPDTDKEYRAWFRFGLTTDTQDITGRVLTTDNSYVSRNKMYLLEKTFKGELMQIPPMFSAVSVDGKRLYELAREGREIERQPRPIVIHDLKIEDYKDNQGVMLVKCSRGTYIRTLIHDMGQFIGTGAVMTGLVRTKSGCFTLNDCHRLSEIEAIAEQSPQKLEEMLMPMESVFEGMPKAHLDEKQTRLFRNGATLDADRVLFDKIYDRGYYIEGSDGVMLGLGKITDSHELEVIQRFNTGAPEGAARSGAEAKEEKPAAQLAGEAAIEAAIASEPDRQRTEAVEDTAEAVFPAQEQASAEATADFTAALPEEEFTWGEAAPAAEETV